MKSALAVSFKSSGAVAKKKAPKKKEIDDPKGVEGSPEEEAGESPEYEQYEIDHAADTVMKAHEHMADPKMMKHVDKIIDKKRKAIKSLDDLRAVAKEKLGSDRQEA